MSGKWKKSAIRKVLIILFGYHLVRRVNIKINFFLQVYLKGVSCMILFPLFVTGVVDTGGKYAAGIVERHQQYR